MKFEFDVHEKRVIREQLYEMALVSANMGERNIFRTLERLANHFTDANVYSKIKRYEADLILDAITKTLAVLRDIADKIKDSDKSKEEKDKSLEQTNTLIKTTETVINKLKERLDVRT